MITITLAWPFEVKFGDGTTKKLPPAAKMKEIVRDAWAPDWTFSARSSDRYELLFEVEHLRKLLQRITGIKRVFASFGINPDVEVDGKPLLEFAWQKQVQEVHYRGLIDQAMKELRRPAMNDGNAAIRVALREGLNKSPWEIERELLQGAE